MLTDQEFESLLSQACSGHAGAARKLVSMYEPEIRRAARVRLNDSRMRRVVDSLDICQSVFGRFFEAATSEKDLELKSPEQLLGLLVRMTRNRVIDEHRKLTAQKRNNGEAVVEASSSAIPETRPGPRTKFEIKELIGKVREKLTPIERQVADFRTEGNSWEEIASKIGGTADSHRKRYERAIKRMRNEFSRTNVS